MNDNIDLVDQLIVTREVSIKGPSRAKTKHPKDAESGWVGISTLDYRFTPARRIMRDIMNAEDKDNV